MVHTLAFHVDRGLVNRNRCVAGRAYALERKVELGVPLRQIPLVHRGSRLGIRNERLARAALLGTRRGVLPGLGGAQCLLGFLIQSSGHVGQLGEGGRSAEAGERAFQTGGRGVSIADSKAPRLGDGKSTKTNIVRVEAFEIGIDRGRDRNPGHSLDLDRGGGYDFTNRSGRSETPIIAKTDPRAMAIEASTNIASRLPLVSDDTREKLPFS